jgi:hypothetical protein
MLHFRENLKTVIFILPNHLINSLLQVVLSRPKYFGRQRDINDIQL